VARDDNMEVSKFVALAETVPAIGRLEHDDLYQAISIYLKVSYQYHTYAMFLHNVLSFVMSGFLMSL
jgi:hypothetical protein